MNEALKHDLEDARCELEELEECGDLEDRFDASLRVANLEQIFALHEERGTEAKWHVCGLCHGYGKHKEYEDEWDCPPCKGKGGSWN